jgi:hypothetical protein
MLGPKQFGSDERLPERIEDLEEARRYIDAIDFGMVKQKSPDVEHGGLGWSPGKFDYHERQYKNWLFLRRKYEQEVLPPPADIDDFWHAHILDTYAYHRDCAAMFGYYLHHFPYFGMRGEDDRAALLEASEHTNDRYLEEFGEEIYSYDPEDDETDGEDRVQTSAPDRRAGT